MTERTAPPDETKKGARHYALREGRLVMTTTSGIHCLGASRGKLSSRCFGSPNSLFEGGASDVSVK
jgi:hypothetical protein